MKRLFILFAALAFLGTEACKKKDDPTLGEPPTEADAQFTYEASSESDNIIIFTANNSELTAKWEFGNGTTGEGTTATGTYPLAGSYEVTLTVFNPPGTRYCSGQVLLVFTVYIVWRARSFFLTFTFTFTFTFIFTFLAQQRSFIGFHLRWRCSSCTALST